MTIASTVPSIPANPRFGKAGEAARSAPFRLNARGLSGTRPAMSESTLSGRTFGALLFDMDGTILNSIAAAERAWTAWAERHGLDVAAFLPTIHGVRGIETITRLALPGVDPAAEAHAILLAEIEDVDGVAAIEGAAAFLGSLPADRWAIVTSSPRRLALRRLAAAGLPMPAVLVTAEDVERGKPAPDCFLLRPSAWGRGSRTASCSRMPRPASRRPRPPAPRWRSSRSRTSMRWTRGIRRSPAMAG